MTTINGVNLGLSGSTGTGAFVGADTPTLITPILGVSSATSLSFSSTSGIIGTTTNNDAAAGSVGEYVNADVSGSPITLSNNSASNITTISLTAGDWDVFGAISIIMDGTTVVDYLSGGASLNNAALPSNPNYYIYINPVSPKSTFPGISITIPQYRLSLSTITTVYLVVLAGFSVTGLTAYGYISARRVR